MLFHPFRKPQPKPEPKPIPRPGPEPKPKQEPKPALYLPKPICPKGHCAPPCPIGQVRSGGACTAPVIEACAPGQIFGGYNCSFYMENRCPIGEYWNGFTCIVGVRFLDNCSDLRRMLERQAKRVQSANAARQNACTFGSAQECSDANAAWQNEESLRQDILARYQQCQIRYGGSYSSVYGVDPWDSTSWLDSLQFDMSD